MDQLFQNMWKFSLECSQIPALLAKCILTISRKLLMLETNLLFQLIGNRQLSIHP